MHAFDILGDPVRRRILEILADKGHPSSGEIVEVISAAKLKSASYRSIS